MDFKKSLITSLSITLGLIAVILIAIIILANDSSKKAGEIGRAKAEINAKNRSLEILTVLQSDSQKAAAYLNQIDSLIITKAQLINSKKELNALAQENGVNLNLEFRDEPQPAENELRKTNVVLNINSQAGGLINFANFLKALEKSKYFLKFTNADLNAEGARLSGTLNGQIFSL